MTVLDVLTSQSHTLIRAEVRAQTERSALERGIVQAVRFHGCSINEVSAVTGLTVEQIRDLLARPLPLAELGDLTGAR